MSLWCTYPLRWSFIIHSRGGTIFRKSALARSPCASFARVYAAVHQVLQSSGSARTLRDRGAFRNAASLSLFVSPPLSLFCFLPLFCWLLQSAFLSSCRIIFYTFYEVARSSGLLPTDSDTSCPFARKARLISASARERPHSVPDRR